MRALFPDALRPIRLRNFRRDRRGAAAVEFALVSVPFFALVFAIVETALVFFAGHVLENGVTQAARLIRTGQAQQQQLDQSAFKQEVCARITGLFNCEGGLKLDVRIFKDFGEIDLSAPIDDDGNLDDDFVFEPGSGGEIVVVRAFYEWPTFVPGFGNNPTKLANGKRLLASAATFRNEAF